MKTDSQAPEFQIRCVPCNAEVGESCTTWEGQPAVCMARTAAAEKIFGKHKFVNGKYVKVLSV
jgi:hypothetical protein